MSTQPEAWQTPLHWLLDRVPEDTVLRIPGNDPVFPSYTNIPIGKLAHQAAVELRRLHEAHDWQCQMVGDRLRRVVKLEAQRDQLLEALTAVISADGCVQGAVLRAIRNASTIVESVKESL